MRSINKLNKRLCDNAEPKSKPYKLNDGGGLYLEVSLQGARHWRYRYTFGGKENRIAIGRYPETAIDEAREAHMGLRKMVAQGIDPSAQRKEQRQLARENPAQTFKEFALEWHTNQKDEWRSRHAENILSRLKADIFPQFGDITIDKVTPRHVIEAIQLICKRKRYDIAKRTLQTCVRIFDYAVGKEKIQFNPARNRKGIIPKRKTKHFAAIKSDQIPELLAKLHSFETPLTIPTRLATTLLMLTFVRTKELIGAPWSEFDLEAGLWIVPESRMKKGRDHMVPLSRQALSILKRLKEMAGNSPYVFPSRSHQHKTMSNNTVLSGLKRMGYNGVMTGHGFRALAMTTIREKLRTPMDVIDLQLAHKRNNSSKPYDRSEFLEERAEMMQEWADFLDKCLAERTLKNSYNLRASKQPSAEIILLSARG